MKDLLIVGFGLAGLSVAKHADDRKLSFDIISDQSQLSSRIAGGILNPIAIKRMKPVWRVEEFLPFAKGYYNSLESTFKTNFYSSRDIKVAIHNIEQENNWFESWDKPRVQPFLIKELEKNNQTSVKSIKLGTVKGGIVNLINLFIKAQEYYEAQNIWFNESFKYSELNLSDTHIEFKNKSYKHLIFCEGFGITQNPFFNDLGIYGNKGDYLIIESKDLQFENILKAKYFLIPLGDDLYKFGATYQREPLNHQPSEESKRQMLEALNKMIDVPYKIVDQVCGIRPTTKDRKPILGTHKTYKNIHIINGFGSRGVMTSPLLGQNLISNIFDGVVLDKEVSIDRIYAQT